MGLTVNTIKSATDALKQCTSSPKQCAAGRPFAQHRRLSTRSRPSHSRLGTEEEEHRRMVRESVRPTGASHIETSAAPSVELLLDLHAQLGEALTWDERTDRLWFVDTNKQKIYSCTDTGEDLFSIDTPEPVGTIALTTNQNLLLAAMNRSVYVVNIAERKVGKAIATAPESHGVDQMRFNDGKASPGGALIVGRMHMEYSKGKPGRLYGLHWDKPEEGHFEELVGPEAIGLPNGLAWDDSVMYHADTYHRTIKAYPSDQNGAPKHSPGKSAEAKIAVKFSEDPGGPDGMCVSREGNLWIAFPEAGCIACYSPKDGKEVARVKVPVNSPTCVTFGGPKLNKIFVSSMKEEGPEAAKHHGGLFVVQVAGEFGLAPAYKIKVPQ